MIMLEQHVKPTQFVIYNKYVCPGCKQKSSHFDYIHYFDHPWPWYDL